MKNIDLSIGLFGGLFDPPHIGHLILAEWVRAEFNLDRIIFIPAFNPPHKDRFSSFKHRYEMTRGAIKGNKKFFVSDIEKNIRGKTYTFEVIRALKKSYKKFGKVAIYLIIGADQWQEIEHWKHPEIILRESKIIVLPRPGYSLKKNKPFIEEILFSNAPFIGISSTMIREMVKKRMCISYLVTPEVLAYIKKNRLYV
ncbi:MAG: nicotinate (nicotinamide) nucleotide adenylyltransferase [bacterium]